MKREIEKIAVSEPEQLLRPCRLYTLEQHEYYYKQDIIH